MFILKSRINYEQMERKQFWEQTLSYCEIMFVIQMRAKYDIWNANYLLFYLT